jgi:transposase InsO family protein
MLPFSLRGLDSDNGSEFINHHLFRYCEARQIQFARGRPYKKDDNAHIEQKNWTHVRRPRAWISPATTPAGSDTSIRTHLGASQCLPDRHMPSLT